MMFRIERHAVIALAFPDWIAPDDLVRFRINDRENVLVLQVDVHLTGDGIVLRHAGFTVEMQRLDDFVLGHIHNRFRFAPLVRDVELMKGAAYVLPSGFASVFKFFTTFICLRSTTPIVLSCAFDV